MTKSIVRNVENQTSVEVNALKAINSDSFKAALKCFRFAISVRKHLLMGKSTIMMEFACLTSALNAINSYQFKGNRLNIKLTILRNVTKTIYCLFLNKNKLDSVVLARNTNYVLNNVFNAISTIA